MTHCGIFSVPGQNGPGSSPSVRNQGCCCHNALKTAALLGADPQTTMCPRTWRLQLHSTWPLPALSDRKLWEQRRVKAWLRPLLMRTSSELIKTRLRCAKPRALDSCPWWWKPPEHGSQRQRACCSTSPELQRPVKARTLLLSMASSCRSSASLCGASVPVLSSEDALRCRRLLPSDRHSRQQQACWRSRERFMAIGFHERT